MFARSSLNFETKICFGRNIFFFNSNSTETQTKWFVREKLIFHLYLINVCQIDVKFFSTNQA